MDIPPVILPLLFGLLACASCETCPPAEDIGPCECSTSSFSQGEIVVECDGGSLKEIDDAFDNLRGKTLYIVKFRNVKGDRLSSLLFWNTRVRRIDFDSCDLQGLSETDRRPAFLGLENSLKHLGVTSSIKGNNQLKKLDLTLMKNLEYLWFFFNNILEVGNDWFAKGPLSLTSIIMNYCGVRKLGDTAFAPLANLRTLSLWGNHIISLKRSMLPNPTSYLQSLYLNNNNITSLSNDMFSGMRSLKAVYLESNSIRRMEEATWSSIWENLNHLDIENNPLECDSHMEWMFSKMRPKKLLGTCDSPAKVKGERLLYFIEINKKLLSFKGKSSGASTKEELLID